MRTKAGPVWVNGPMAWMTKEALAYLVGLTDQGGMLAKGRWD
jgi:hypothetical protein